MAEFIMIVPTRGRPQAVRQLAEAFSVTCTVDTQLLIAVDDDDPDLDGYQEEVKKARDIYPRTELLVQVAPGCMAVALNMAARDVVAGWPDAKAIGFMGDDHRPRTVSWDKRYVNSLEVAPGIVYGNDLIHGENLPTQFAVSASIVKALGFMSPGNLRHMYIDNYWRDIGNMAGCLKYRGDVVVEHMHPVASKSEYDEGYERVNAPEIFSHDAAEYERYMTEHGTRDADMIREAVAR
jgi:hypothetical protein